MAYLEMGRVGAFGPLGPRRDQYGSFGRRVGVGGIWDDLMSWVTPAPGPKDVYLPTFTKEQYQQQQTTTRTYTPAEIRAKCVAGTWPSKAYCDELLKTGTVQPMTDTANTAADAAARAAERGRQAQAAQAQIALMRQQSGMEEADRQAALAQQQADALARVRAAQEQMRLRAGGGSSLPLGPPTPAPVPLSITGSPLPPVDSKLGWGIVLGVGALGLAFLIAGRQS